MAQGQGDTVWTLTLPRTACVNLCLNTPRPLILFSYIICAATLQMQMKCSMNGSNESFWVLICKNRGKTIISHIVQFSVFDTPKGFYKHYFSFCNKGCVLSLSFFFFFLFAHCMACGILVPWPGVKPLSPALESQNLKPLDRQGSPFFSMMPMLNIKKQVILFHIAFFFLSVEFNTCPVLQITATIKIKKCDARFC